MKYFFLNIKPPRTTYQQKRVRICGGYPRFYEPPKLKEARNIYQSELHRHAPKKPMDGPIFLEVNWMLKAKGHKDAEWKTTRPDLDNMCKLLLDCMTNVGFWHDDSQVVELLTRKMWSNQEGIEIRIIELE